MICYGNHKHCMLTNELWWTKGKHLALSTSVWRAAHSRNCIVRLDVSRPPSCSTVPGQMAGQMASLSSSMLSILCNARTLSDLPAPTLRPARVARGSKDLQKLQRSLDTCKGVTGFSETSY